MSFQHIGKGALRVAKNYTKGSHLTLRYMGPIELSTPPLLTTLARLLGCPSKGPRCDV